MEAPYKKPKKIKIFLLATMFITLGGVIAYYIVFKQDSKAPELIPESVEPDATLSIGKIRQTATRKGKKEWSLEARSAHYVDKTGQMVLKDLVVTFFLNDKSEIILAADQGMLITDSNDIEVSGNVVVKNKEYRLLTESLSYAHDKRVLYSNAPVKITGTSARLAADSISLDLNNKKLTLEGGVETTLDYHFTR
jgi:LPS export ABC transporter protein LptC